MTDETTSGPVGLPVPADVLCQATEHLYRSGRLYWCGWDCALTVKDVMSEFEFAPLPPGIRIRPKPQHLADVAHAAMKGWRRNVQNEGEEVARTLMERWALIPNKVSTAK